MNAQDIEEFGFRALKGERASLWAPLILWELTDEYKKFVFDIIKHDIGGISQRHPLIHIWTW
jgi:hypothetical protein